jgi:hypothetical protein
LTNGDDETWRDKGKEEKKKGFFPSLSELIIQTLRFDWPRGVGAQLFDDELLIPTRYPSRRSIAL